jgi:hypothetical protein
MPTGHEKGDDARHPARPLAPRLRRLAYPSNGKGLAAATRFAFAADPASSGKFAALPGQSRESEARRVWRTQGRASPNREAQGACLGGHLGPSLADRNGPGGSIGRSVQLTLSA